MQHSYSFSLFRLYGFEPVCSTRSSAPTLGIIQRQSGRGLCGWCVWGIVKKAGRVRGDKKKGGPTQVSKDISRMYVGPYVRRFPVFKFCSACPEVIPCEIPFFLDVCEAAFYALSLGLFTNVAVRHRCSSALQRCHGDSDSITMRLERSWLRKQTLGESTFSRLQCAMSEIR